MNRNGMTNEWWRKEGAREIHRGESDGQRFTSVFMRTIDGGTLDEYAVVECSDGDYLDYVFGGFVLSGGNVTLIAESDYTKARDAQPL